MCQAFQVSRGGFYTWLDRPISNRAAKNMILLKEIKQIHTETEGRYGSPRTTDRLHDKGYSVSRPRVARLMSSNGISAIYKKKFKVTTDNRHNYPVSPNLLQQDFSADQPEAIWVSDITYIFTQEGWLYLTVIIDLYNRMIVGWSMSKSLRASETTIPALRHVYNCFNPASSLIFHSDQGIQYACNNFREQLSTFNMNQSMSAKGNCWDNAVAESFFGTLKKELVYRNSYKTRWEARQSIFKYIETFYNRTRKHSYLGNKSPVQFMEIKNAA